LNHKTASVEVREVLSFSPSRLAPGLQRLKATPRVEEACILSTCNRTEIYCVCKGLQGIRESLASFLSDFHETPEEGFLPSLYQHIGEQAPQHLFEVASGLDSMIVGESEILSQVREALQAAQQEGTAGPTLNSLFRHALQCGKRARNETEISQGGLSVASVAVELAKSIFGNLNGHRTMVLGAGETSELTLKHLVHSGVSAVVVANRSYERAVSLAERFQGSAVKFDAFPELLPKVDIVIASTSAPHFVCSKQAVAAAMRERKERPLLLIDIAVPRDIDPAVNELPDVFLYDIDDLEKVVQVNFKDRQKEIPKVQRIVREVAGEFNAWLRAREAAPLIVSLQDKAEGLRLAEVTRALGKLDGLPDGQRKAVEEMTRRLVAKLLADPLSAIRQFSGREDASYRLKIVRELLGLGTEDGDSSSPVAQDEGLSGDAAGTETKPDSNGNGEDVIATDEPS